MDKGKPDGPGQSKDSPTNGSEAYTEGLLFNRRIAVGLLDLEKNAFYMYAAKVRDVRILKKEDGWLGMVKAEIDGEHKICYFFATRFEDVIIALTTSMDSKHVDWWQDKYPPA